MKVQVRVCEQGAITNGRFAFTDKFTLLTELLQNARRARATEIRVDFDANARTLQVSDNGVGIIDFQKLLTFNETGWDDATVEMESPFGIGFSKCLYAAQRVTVVSRGKRLELDCSAALALQAFVVQDDPLSTVEGTVIRLEGVDLPELEFGIERLVCGFSVPVIFNGVELARSHALDAMRFWPCDIGYVHLAGAESGELGAGTAVYLQGQLIRSDTYRHPAQQVHVVHLDPRRFLARLPDREELIDAPEQHRAIHAAMAALWRVVLEEQKSQACDVVQFAEKFFRTAWLTGHVDLFDDVPLVPRHACSWVAGYPVLGRAPNFLKQLVHHVDRKAIERGDIRLAEIAAWDDNALLHWQYAKARDLVLVDTTALGISHWVKRHVRNLSREDFSIVARGVSHSVEFTGRWINPIVTFCEAVVVKHGDDTVELLDSPVFSGGVVYYPAQAVGGDVVRQVSDYEDEYERRHDSDCEADEEAFADFVRRTRSDDPISTLLSLMSELSLERYPRLSGKSFRIAVGDSPEGHTVQLDA